MRRYAYWTALCLFLGFVVSKFSPETGFTSLIRFGSSWQDRRLGALHGLPVATAANSNGYDGQFYAQLAVDPLLLDAETSKVLDAPAYRARRVLAPATAYLLGLGRPWWILQVYALLNVVCWLVLAWLLRCLLATNDWQTFARWIGCLFSMGVLESVRQSLVDLPALLLLVLAVAAHSRLRPKASAGWLALASLAKESSLLGSFALIIGPPPRPFLTKQRLYSLGIACLPLALWAYYVSQRMPPSAEASGLGNFTWPLAGLAGHVVICTRELVAGNWDGRFSMGLLAVAGFAVQAWSLWRAPDFRSAWWRIGAAYSLLLLFLGPWVWSGYWAASRALLPMTVAFNLLLPGNTRSFWPLWVAGNLTLLHAIWRFL